MGKQRSSGTHLDPSFASDNVAGVSPSILAALSTANQHAAVPYGGDSVSAQLLDWAKSEFGSQAEIYPVFNGTGANVVALQAMLPRWGAAICSMGAHLNNDEGAAPERLGAIKLLPRPTSEGKLTSADVKAELGAMGFVHAAQPLAVTLTQSTEVGTLYSLEELATVSSTAHYHGMGVHIDGARLSNAAAALGVSLGELVAQSGADVVSLGGTKNGALAAEALVVVNPERVAGMGFIRKFSMQLASKQRFIAAQLLELFATDLWQRNAYHANAQAAQLGARLQALEGVQLSAEPSVNAVFPEVPADMAARIQSTYLAHTWDTAPTGNPVLRLMCSWETTDEQIDDLVRRAAAKELAHEPG
ncbi:threonine aldolase family protein [Nesterenkonia haasae]|uniref:threonine aldolase family protein n=1 Tax=Nesterenkonia haasae TaxID=2587813 RepID=UPI001390EFD2|nr:beta-eliminating lyase-related protein [Nesterenkonia haasae]NDK30412.1 threonine aldolase [Nesterenkonia haasae]